MPNDHGSMIVQNSINKGVLPNNEAFSAVEVARFWECSTEYVRSVLRDDRVHGVKCAGKWLIPRASLINWCNRSRRRSGEPVYDWRGRFWFE